MVKVTIEIDGKVTDVLTGDYAWGVIGEEKAYTYVNSRFVKGRTNRRVLITSMIYSMPQLVQSITEEAPETMDHALRALQTKIEAVRTEIRGDNRDH